MTLLEKVTQLQNIKPPLGKVEFNNRLSAWKTSQGITTKQAPVDDTADLESLLDGDIVSPKKAIDSVNVIPVVESNENLESNLAPTSSGSLESLRLNTKNPKLNTFPNDPVVVEPTSPKPVLPKIDLNLSDNTKNEKSWKDNFDNFFKKITGNSEDYNEEEVAKMYEDNALLGEASLNKQRENTKRFRSTTEAIFNSNTVYQLGLDGGTITELDNDLDFTKKIRSQAIENYKRTAAKSRGTTTDLPDSFLIDQIVREVKEKYIQEEDEERRINVKNTAAASKERGDYKFVLDSGINQHVSELNKQEKVISNLNTRARNLRKIINTTDNVEARSQAENELINVAKEAEEAKKGLDYTYAYDPLTGKRVGALEEVNDAEDWTEEIQGLATEYKSLDLELLEQEYFTHVIEFDDLQEDLDKKIDLDNRKTPSWLRFALDNYVTNLTKTIYGEIFLIEL